MIKTISIAAFTVLSCTAGSENKHLQTQTNQPLSIQTDTSMNIYGFKVKSLDGSTIDFSAFKGKKILVVNTASQCGFTPQYKDLEALYKKYKDKLVIVGFPTNDFGQQEPGSNAEIKVFCEKNYGVSFPVAEKTISTGAEMSAIYQWLTQKKLNGILDAEVTWNFNKFLLDEQGRLITKFESNVKPMSEEITRYF